MDKLELREIDKQLGKALRDARKNNKMTQEEVARTISSAQSFVAKYECGERILSTAEFMHLANVVKLDWKTVLRKQVS